MSTFLEAMGDLSGVASVYTPGRFMATPQPGDPPGTGSFLGAMGNVDQIQSVYRSAQERAQDISRGFGIEPSPSFGSTIPERLTADFAKGVASSLPGRGIATLAGKQEAALVLRNLPASQPIPYFPDFDTLGITVAEAPLFALIPAAAAPGRLLGRGLANLAGVQSRAARSVATALARPSAEHIAVSKAIAEQLSGKLAEGMTQAFEAVGGAVSAGGIFGGAEALTGGTTSDIAFSSIMSAAAAFTKPAFQAGRAIGTVHKLTSERFLEAEKALADVFDGDLAKFTTLGMLDESAARKAVYQTAEDLSPGMGKDIEGVMETLGIGRRASTPGKVVGFGEHIPELRRMVATWEEAVSANRIGKMEQLARKGGSTADAANTAWRGFTTSVETTLRKLGPNGSRLASVIRRKLESEQALFARLGSQFDDVIRKASDEEWTAFINAIESGRPIPERFTELARWLDDGAITMLQDAGVDIVRTPGTRPGAGSGFFPRIWEMDDLRQWIRVPENEARLARKMGQDPAHFRTTLNEMVKTLDESIESPARLLQTNLDFNRKWKQLTHADAVELGMPIGTPREIFVRYLKQVADRVTSAQHFGKEQEIFNELVEKAVTGANLGRFMSKLVQDSAKRAAGLSYTPAGEITKAVRWFMGNVTIPSKLSLAVISNSSQSANTIATTGARHYAAGLQMLHKEVKLAKRLGGANVPEIEVLRRIRVSVEELAGDLMNDLTTGAASGRFLLPATAERSGLRRLNLGGWILNKTGFSAVEKFNRLAAAYSGKSYLQSTVQSVMSGSMKPGSKAFIRANRDFARLGLNLPDIARRGGMSVDELFSGAMKISNQSQFQVRAFDLPHYWSSPNAAAFRMLKTFAFNQSRFVLGKNGLVRRSLRDFAKTGDPRDLRPAATFVAGFPVAGFMVGGMRNMLRGKGFDPSGDDRDGPMQDLAAAYGWVGGLGFLMDTLKTVDDGERSLAAFAMGPVWADVISTTNAFIDSAKQGSGAPLAKRMLRSTPLIAQDLGGIRTAIENEYDLNRRPR